MRPSPSRPPRRGRAGSLLAGVLALGLGTGLLAGCSPHGRAARVSVPPLVGEAPNGEQKRTGPQLVADARSALSAAKSLHLVGTLAIDGTPVPVDLQLVPGGNLAGSIGTTAGALQVQRAGDVVFVRPTGSAAATDTLADALGLPSTVALPTADNGFWRLAAADAAGVVALGLPDLVATLLPAGITAQPALRSGDDNGTPVVTASWSTGARVDVAVTGAVRVVRLVGGAAGFAGLAVDDESTQPPPFALPDATPTV